MVFRHFLEIAEGALTLQNQSSISAKFDCDDFAATLQCACHAGAACGGPIYQ
jgi:hypothetical protein